MENLYWVEFEGGEFLEIPFPSELDYEKSIDWYNSTSKKQIIHFCNKKFVSLDLVGNLGADETAIFKKADTLKPFWEILAMAVYAWSELKPDPRMLNLIDKAQLWISQ